MVKRGIKEVEVEVGSSSAKPESSQLRSWADIIKANAERRAREPDEEGEGEEGEGGSLFPEQTLDEFMQEVFQETSTSANSKTEEGGLPSLQTLKNTFKTKSAIIRHLHSLGASVKDISKHTGIRYQMVRNVLTNELKRGPNEPFMVDNYRAPSLGKDPMALEEPKDDFED